MKKRFYLVSVSGLILAGSAIIGIRSIMFAGDLPPSLPVGHYVLQNLPTYRKIDNAKYSVDASAFIELARAIAVENDSHKVTFDERNLNLKIVSTPDNLRRFRECFIRMHGSMGVQLESPSISFDAEQLKKMITEQ